MTDNKTGTVNVRMLGDNVISLITQIFTRTTKALIEVVSLYLCALTYLIIYIEYQKFSRLVLLYFHIRITQKSEVRVFSILVFVRDRDIKLSFPGMGIRVSKIKVTNQTAEKSLS